MLTSSLVSDSIVDTHSYTFVVFYKFAFDFSLFHCEVRLTVIYCIVIIGSLSVFLGSESVFSIFVSISVQNTDESVFLEQGRSQAIQWIGSLRTKSGPSNSFYNYGDFKTCMS